MAFPFRMTFTGLCALVPNTNGTEGTVLLVDASNPPGTTNLHVHVPSLRYRGQKYSLAGTEVFLNLTNPQPPALELFWPIPPPPSPSHPQMPAPGEEDSLHWIAELADSIAPLKGGCFSNPRPAFITSRIKLRAGHLSTSYLIEDRTDPSNIQVLPWALEDADGHIGFYRAMAAQFSLNAMIDGGTIDISTYSIPLVEVAGEAVVEVENACGCTDRDGELEDFAWFFDLSTATTTYIPVLQGGGATDTMCPPARFSAKEDA